MSMAENLVIHPANLVQALGVRWPAVSGLLTGVAAGADVAGFVNLSVHPYAVSLANIRFVTTTAFASAQALAYRVNKVTGFTAIHSSGGTAVQAHYKRQSQVRGSAVGDRVPLTELSGYIGATGAISGATYTAEDTDEPDVFAVGAGSTLPGVYEDYAPRDGLCYVLEQNEGLVVNNQILMGASGVGNLFVGFDLYRMV